MSIFKSNWGKWTDLTVGNYFETRYLLQGRRHKNGAVQFRVARSGAVFAADALKLEDFEKLKEVIS